MFEGRLDTLKWLYDEVRQSIEDVPADKKSPLVSQLRAIAKEIEEIEGARSGTAEVVETNGLIDFQKRLAQRQSASPAPRSSTGR